MKYKVIKAIKKIHILFKKFILKSKILILILISSVNLLYGQNSELCQNLAGTKGYIFSEKYALETISKSRTYKYLNYWKISCSCVFNLDSVVVSNLEKAKKKTLNLNNFTRQYLPYVNKKGQLILIVTFSLISPSNRKSLEERLPTYLRYVYDDDSEFYKIIYNYTTDSIMHFD